MHYNIPRSICDHPDCESWANEAHEIDKYVLLLCEWHGDKWGIIETIEDIKQRNKEEFI